ncbi:MAG TPA: sugar phosphate isomerase/epimerase family protein [Candidatus Binataceae bacterium]|nr:sugar phosphate isomerase/epimerase family protein [Candidatus Binataceae bacterium]
MREPLFKLSAKSAEVEDQIHYVADQGFAGVEDNCLATRTRIEQQRMGAALRARGLHIGCFVFGFDHMMHPLWNRAGAEALRRLRREYAICREAADRTGGKYVTVVTGREESVTDEHQIECLTDNLRLLALDAERDGLIFCLEPVSRNRVPQMLVQELGAAYRIVKAVNSPSVKLIYDTCHVSHMAGSLTQNYLLYRDEIAVVQLADMPNRVAPGSGCLELIPLLKAMLDGKYRGHFELECVPAYGGVEGELAVISSLQTIDAHFGQA